MQIVVDLIHKSKENAGNDLLLPFLVLLLIRAKPPKLISHIRYILRFRNQPELQKGANQFCMTNMMGAVSFIYNMTPSDLTLTKEERDWYFPKKLEINTLPVDETVPSDIEISPVHQTQQILSPTSQQFNGLAAQVYQSTSGFFGQLGGKATEVVDGLLETVMGPIVNSEMGINSKPTTPYTPRSPGSPSSSQYSPGSQYTDSPPSSPRHTQHQPLFNSQKSTNKLPSNISWWEGLTHSTSTPNMKDATTTNNYPGLHTNSKTGVSPVLVGRKKLSQSRSFDRQSLHENNNRATTKKVVEIDEDFELQLALALSLSEVKTLGGGGASSESLDFLDPSFYNAQIANMEREERIKKEEE